MGYAEDCLKKTYVKLYYIPPPNAQVPQNCNTVLFTKYPEITYPEGMITDLFAIDVLCAHPYAEGAGGVMLLLQITTYIKWEISFLNQQGQMVRETPMIYCSMPMIYRLKGPLIALRVVSPWQIKIGYYAGMISHLFKKIDEVEAIMALVVKRRIGFCPSDIQALQKALNVLEAQLNSYLRGIGAGQIASLLDGSRPAPLARFGGKQIGKQIA
jgi:hypothetical protein